jgi:hypothetical protein
MTDIEARDAAEELDRLADWGRGSISWSSHDGPAGPDGRLPAGLPATLAAMVAAVMATPLLLEAATTSGPPPWPSVMSTLIVSALLGGYVVATVFHGPALPRRELWLWLFAKTAATTMTAVALAAIALAGPFGLVVAVPAGAVASISAIGTFAARHGHALGALPVVGAFAATGYFCLRLHFSAPADNAVAHGIAIAAFCVAAIAALLAGSRPIRRSSAPPPRSRRTPDQ